MFGGQNFFPTQAAGLGAAAVKTGINWGTMLSTAQKALGVVNQAIPVFYQIGPIYRNAKTALKVMNEFRKDDTGTPQPSSQSIEKVDNQPRPTTTQQSSNRQQVQNTTTNSQTNTNEIDGIPTFFV